MSNDSLYLFVHLHKCAGSSLNHHLKKNFPRSTVLNVFAGPKSYGYHHFDPEEFRKHSQKFYQNLTLKKQQKLKFIYGHKIPDDFGDRLKTNKKPFYFTFLRDPAQRIASLYNYYRGWYEREIPSQKNKPIYHQRFLVSGQSPDFKTWLDEKFFATDNVLPLHTMTEYFQQLGYLEAGAITKLKIKQALNKFSFIGFTDTFTTDSLYLYHRWGVNKFFKRRNISTKYFQLKNHPSIQKKLKKILTDDYLFYQLAKDHKANWLKQQPEFDLIVAKMKKKSIATKWQQLIYDWPANFHFFSKWLRTKCPFYGKLLDKFKATWTKVADKS